MSFCCPHTTTSRLCVGIALLHPSSDRSTSPHGHPHLTCPCHQPLLLRYSVPSAYCRIYNLTWSPNAWMGSCLLSSVVCHSGGRVEVNPSFRSGKVHLWCFLPCLISDDPCSACVFWLALGGWLHTSDMIISLPVSKREGRVPEWV